MANIHYHYYLTSQKQEKFLQTFNKMEVQMLDELIIRCYPEAFIAFIEKTSSEQKDKTTSKMLQDLMIEAKKTKSTIDRQQILEKTRE